LLTAGGHKKHLGAMGRRDLGKFLHNESPAGHLAAFHCIRQFVSKWIRAEDPQHNRCIFTFKVIGGPFHELGEIENEGSLDLVLPRHGAAGV